VTPYRARLDEFCLLVEDEVRLWVLFREKGVSVLNIET